MSAKYESRAAVLKALRAGRRPQEVASFLKVHRSSVYRLKKDLDKIQDAGKGDVPPAQKQHKKVFFPCPHSQHHTELAKANLNLQWPEEILPPSSSDCNPLDYFM